MYSNGRRLMNKSPDSVESLAIMSLAAQLVRQLRLERRFPARLDEEDYNDISQAGVLAALTLFPRYDPSRGSMRAFMARAMVRAMLNCAWAQAQVGITGDHDALQIWSVDGNTDEEFAHEPGRELSDQIQEAIASPDVAEEIEAFDHVWQTRYARLT
jgi:DNA-directed RNA polymerase specialized sigma subunit